MMMDLQLYNEEGKNGDRLKTITIHYINYYYPVSAQDCQGNREGVRIGILIPDCKKYKNRLFNLYFVDIEGLEE